MEGGFREGLEPQGSKEALWGRGLYWTWKIEQNLGKEKREGLLARGNGERKRLRVEMKKVQLE